MPVMDEFKEERDALKSGTLKQKLAYFWDYYKWHAIGGCAAAALVFSFAWQTASRKDTAFYALLLNGTKLEYAADDSGDTSAFAQYAGIDEAEYRVVYDASLHLGTPNDYLAAQKLMVSISAKELDVIVSDPDTLAAYAHQENFYDLRNLLSPDQLERYKDSFYYVDGALMREYNAAIDEGDYSVSPDYRDPRPEDMQEPIPVGIRLGEDCPLLAQYGFQGSTPAVCVLINTLRPELAVRFIDFLCGG